MTTLTTSASKNGTRKPVSVGRPAVKANPTPAKETEGKELASQRAEEAIRQIQDEQGKMARNEGLVVLNLIVIGIKLLELQAATKKTRDWTKRIQSLGYHPRAACRLLKLGKSGWAGNGTEGSETAGRLTDELARRLPPDPQKLEWICRIPCEQLESFLDAMDCKKAGRKAVADAVKAALGEERAAAGPPAADRILGSFERALAKAISALREMAPGEAADIRDRLRRVLDLEFAARSKAPEPAPDSAAEGQDQPGAEGDEPEDPCSLSDEKAETRTVIGISE